MIASSKRAVAAAAWLLLVLRPIAARADAPVSPPTEEQIEAARVLYHDARELRRQGRLHEAVDKAMQALAIAATPVTALEAGELLVESGRLVEARDVVRSVALMPVSPRESDKGRDARQLAAALGSQLDMRIPKIAVAARPAGVTLLLDGKPLAPMDPTAWLGVDPGPHAIVVRVDDRPCTTINLTLSEGEERTLELHDAASACRPEPPAVELPRSPVAPDVTTRPAAPVPPPARSPAPRLTGWQWAGLAVGGAGVIAVGVGGGLAVHAKSDYDGVASECPARGCSQDGFDVRTSARSLANAATIVMAVGGVAVGFGAAMWFVPPSSTGTSAVSAFVGPGTVGLAGSF
jgi:hypothetical protein